MSLTLFDSVFLAAVLLLFYILPWKLKALRGALLLASSLAYLYHLNSASIPPLLVSILYAYLAGMLIELFRESDTRKRAGRKRTNYGIITAVIFITPAVLALLLFKLVPMIPFGILGFSYYTFQIISYFIDISEDKLDAERNIVDFALYLSFFPKLISGPIERAESLLPQLKALDRVKLWEPVRFSEAFSYILFGYFMKLMVADRIAPFADAALDSPANLSAVTLILGSLAYTVRIYCDFAGYSLTAIGVGLLFGVRLSPNFNAPYMAESISDFWRRWHISLSKWLTDYIYIPLGGSRRGTARRCLNVMTVFVICGLWHGDGAKFIAWGALHGLYSITGVLIKNRQNNKNQSLFIKILKHILTFAAVSTAWIPFGASSLSRAGLYIWRMFTAWAPLSAVSKELARLEFVGTERNIFFISLAAVVISDIIVYIRREPLPETAARLPYPVRYLLWAVCAAAVLIFGVYGPELDAAEFMYMQF